MITAANCTAHRAVGGLERTANRVGDVFFDEMERSGRTMRLSDLAMFARGVCAIRNPQPDPA
jgi:hypothetical protein